MLYKVVLTFQSVDETLVCDHSNESYWAKLECDTVYYALYNNEVNARALIGHSAVSYCAGKPTDKLRVFGIIIY